MRYTAIYLCSDIENGTIEFELEIGGHYSNTKEGFQQLTDAFTIAVDGFGKTQPFPKEMLEEINEDGNRLERLLKDTEFIPEKTYYLKMPATQMFYSLNDVDVYQLCGINETMCMFMTRNKEIINLVQLKHVKSVFSKLE